VYPPDYSSLRGDGEALIMVALRSPDLQQFLDLTRDAIAVRAGQGDPAATAASKIFGTLARGQNEHGANAAKRLPACVHLGTALENATTGPRLAWRHRPGAHGAFAAGHANAIIIGTNGIEPSDDVMIGVSLVAPGIVYPDHNHPPEEVYLVLSQGDWRQDDNPWHEPGIGGLVYNPPGILHSMRAHQAPLFAIWCLWVGGKANAALS
jgi:quercetin dioxygenase-like cupin family protein